MNLTKDSSGALSYPRCMLAGAVSGCIGSFVGSPFYLVKIIFTFYHFFYNNFSLNCCGFIARTLIKSYLYYVIFALYRIAEYVKTRCE